MELRMIEGHGARNRIVVESQMKGGEMKGFRPFSKRERVNE